MKKNYILMLLGAVVLSTASFYGIQAAHAAALPPVSRFSSGSVLQASDMQAIVQNISDLQTQVGQMSTGNAGLINDNVNITASGGIRSSNSVLSLSGSLKGSSTGFGLPYAVLNVADTATNNVPGTPGITGLTVNHAVNAGAGTGNRTGIYSILTHNAATPGSSSDTNWYTSIWAQMIANHDDGGTAGNPKGNFFGIGSITSLCGSCRNVVSLVGAEHDVAAAAGSSVAEKIGLQIVQINDDAVQGSVFDGAIAIVNDRLGISNFNSGVHPGWNYGIAFGKPGNDWPIAPGGTIIGAPATANQKTAAHGVDFSTVTFSQDAFKSPGFTVSNTGAISSNSSISSGGASAGFFFNDRTTTGQSAWYRQGDVTRLWDPVGGDLFAVTNTGKVRLTTYGAGTLQTDANGTITVSSDERLKNVRGVFAAGLDAIHRLTPIEYTWKPTSGYDTQTLYAGFSAQNVQAALPEAVGVGSNGYLTLQDRPILAALVNAINSLGVSVSNGVTTFTSLAAQDMSASRVRTNNLCVGDTCVTPEEFKAMVATYRAQQQTQAK